MKPVLVGDLLIGDQPVLVATALAETVEGMLADTERWWAAGANAGELRIDRLRTIDDIAELVRRVDGPHIVACRTPSFGGFFEGTEDERIDRLAAASDAGATCVDVEFLAEAAGRDRLIKRARSNGTPVLVGFEDMGRTPPKAELLDGVRRVADLKPDLVKLAVRAASHEDLLTVLGVALEMRALLEVPFAAIALGPHGAPSRPLALAFGASFTYCAAEGGGAPGQLTVAETREVLETVSVERWSCSSS
jgi:3-dehydroquinate dehydratase-1